MSRDGRAGLEPSVLFCAPGMDNRLTLATGRGARKLKTPILFSLLFWITLGGAAAQSETVVTLDLGVDVAAPGAQVFVPVTFSNSDSRPVSNVSLEVSFPKKQLAFVEVGVADAAKPLELKIAAELAAGASSDESLLKVEATSSGPIPKGDLLKLSFTISKEAKLNDDIVLKNLKQTARTLQGESLQARGANGMVTVLQGAFFACFFYMH